MRVRTLLSTLVVAATAPWMAHAQSPNFVSVEGGLACSRNKPVLANQFDLGLGKEGCGGTGAIELGTIGKPVLGVFDLWAIRARYTTFQDKASGDYYGEPLQTTFTDRRYVLDAEVGKKTPFGMFGGTSYVTAGVRYAAWSGRQDVKTVYGAVVANRIVTDLETNGIGPRIGLRSHIPLGSHWMIESRSGASALFGNYDGKVTINGVFERDSKSAGTVFNIDSSSALSYKFTGADTGPVVSVGLFSEYWFGQSKFDGVKDNRHSLGPFVRYRMPLP